MTTPIRAALYLRTSTNDQENSIELQRSHVVPYADRCGYRVVAEGADEGIRGDADEAVLVDRLGAAAAGF